VSLAGYLVVSLLAARKGLGWRPRYRPDELVRSDTGTPHGGEPNHDGEAGQVGHRAVAPSDELPARTVVTPSGRVSAAVDVWGQPVSVSSLVRLARLDAALTWSADTPIGGSPSTSRTWGDPGARSSELFDKLNATGDDLALIAVEPGHRQVQMVTDPRPRIRLADRTASAR
jgi:hypothetical protein